MKIMLKDIFTVLNTLVLKVGELTAAINKLRGTDD
jgi:hypothetical protein